MGQDKKKLTELLKFVKRLYYNPDNKEFAAGIDEMVLNGTRTRNWDNKEKRSLNQIEEYLSLDFNIDSRTFPDYSFITNLSVQEQLNADYREMLRYEFGTRNHRIDFPEFCRFAALQIELLVNYYFDKKYESNVELIKDAVKRRYPRTVFDSYVNSVSSINLKTKINTLKTEFDLKAKTISLFLNVTEVRNKQSHRSLDSISQQSICEVENRLKSEGIDVDKYYDFNKAKNILGEDVFNNYQFEKWYISQPFKEVREGISSLSYLVHSSTIK